MGKLGGRWIDLDGTTVEGQHNCRVPWLMSITRTGAVWECGTCWDRWRVSDVTVDSAHPRREWQRLGRELTRSDVIDQLMVMTAGTTSPSLRTPEAISDVLVLLEEMDVVRWRHAVSPDAPGLPRGRMDA